MHVVPARFPPAHTASAAARPARDAHTPSPERAARSDTHRLTSSDTPRPEAHALDDRAKGVMRLLQDGHFKGVADVRLRINFHQEITRQQTAHLKEVAQEGVAGVIETIASQVNALIESDPLNDDQTAALGDMLALFEAATREAGQAFPASERPNLGSLTSALQDAFETLYAAVQAVLEPQASEPDEAPPLIANEALDSAVAPVAAQELELSENDLPPSSDFASRLAATFAQALGGLNETIEATDLLPPLSQRQGKGVAYARFVNEYNQLRSLAGVYPTVDLSA